MSFRRGVRVGVDWGDARIGVARCDPDGVLATPYATVKAGEREVADLLAILAELGPAHPSGRLLALGGWLMQWRLSWVVGAQVG